MHDPRNWPVGAPKPRENEAFVSMKDLSPDQIKVIQDYSAAAADYISDLPDDMSDEDAAEVMSQVYAHSAKLIQSITNIRPHYQMRLAEDGTKIEIRVLCYRTIH